MPDPDPFDEVISVFCGTWFSAEVVGVLVRTRAHPMKWFCRRHDPLYEMVGALCGIGHPDEMVNSLHSDWTRLMNCFSHTVGPGAT